MIEDLTHSEHSGSLELDLHQHRVCWFLPLGGEITAGLLELPGGALIQGKFNGRIVCKSGSLILADTGVFSGQVEADRIYVDGRIESSGGGKISSLLGRQLVAVSERATGEADLMSQAFAIHTKTFSARFTTIPRP